MEPVYLSFCRKDPHAPLISASARERRTKKLQLWTTAFAVHWPRSSVSPMKARFIGSSIGTLPSLARRNRLSVMRANVGN